jgi:hypothetical protein
VTHERITSALTWPFQELESGMYAVNYLPELPWPILSDCDPPSDGEDQEGGRDSEPERYCSSGGQAYSQGPKIEFRRALHCISPSPNYLVRGNICLNHRV